MRAKGLGRAQSFLLQLLLFALGITLAWVVVGEAWIRFGGFGLGFAFIVLLPVSVRTIRVRRLRGLAVGLGLSALVCTTVFGYFSYIFASMGRF